MKVANHRKFRGSILAIALACCFGLVGLSTEAEGAEDAPETVRVLTFNLWNGGDTGKQPLDRTVEVIKRSQADVVGLQETGGLAPEGQPRPDRAAEIAERLGWHYLDQGGRMGIISRFEIVASTPKKWGVKLALPSGRWMYAFNVHLAHSPYQPYQLLGIPYGDAPFIATEAEAVRFARESRGSQVAEMLAEVKAVAEEGAPMVLTGDFNEPSHRDWTEASTKAKLCPLKVEWPSTRAVEDAGFVDAYRSVHPDPVESRGLTWTPTTKVGDPKDHHDRIDFVFVGGFDRPNTAVKAAQIIGESQEAADVVVSPYPSDHRAVVAELELPAGESTTTP
ncbi:endonuclease/exonuclease/phosphatase family protein [Planctomyces sp. SH-PL62]|uniref:endonuclease/exonuclease/phosphatase family protein n=1 Tax=Planctomyces sp. SH-PL62 TaxID=1636152 RepID=UPI00078C1B89|nr:endonuclease/exonuclease/phosphatase family protein [Planctomyces sp. SH-PL62]AMV38754.1 Endonuclease/Exonuclease/phosphatase family protein [Planctomyces sp. SH-PL62]